jgi:hypothetical protein
MHNMSWLVSSATFGLGSLDSTPGLDYLAHLLYVLECFALLGGLVLCLAMLTLLDALFRLVSLDSTMDLPWLGAFTWILTLLGGLVYAYSSLLCWVLLLMNSLSEE